MSSLVILFVYLLEFASLKGFTITKLDQFIVKILKPANALAIFFRAAITYLVSALIIQAVNGSSFKVIEEISRQLEIPVLLERKLTRSIPLWLI